MSDYQETLQHPEYAFESNVLKRAEILKNKLGLPILTSGNFAVTACLKLNDYNRVNPKLAVRCFYKEVQDLQDRYQYISDFLNTQEIDFLVPFKYNPNGIKVHGKSYPIVEMDWVEGDSLYEYINKNIDNADKLRKLANEFKEIGKKLSKLGMAHGDLQNGNILVRPDDKPILIDYDGIFVPNMPFTSSNEIGHSSFQHPERDKSFFNEKLDYFSLIVIYVSLIILASSDGKIIWDKYSDSERLLFKPDDYKKPYQSEIFNELVGHQEVGYLIKKIQNLCFSDISDLPRMSHFLEAFDLPDHSKSKASKIPQKRKNSIVRISDSYSVLSSKNIKNKKIPFIHISMITITSSIFLWIFFLGPQLASIRSLQKVASLHEEEKYENCLQVLNSIIRKQRILPPLKKLLTNQIPSCQAGFNAQKNKLEAAKDFATKGSFASAINSASSVKGTEESTLYVEASGLINNWGKRILDLGEERVQEGDIETAISFANSIPSSVETEEIRQKATAKVSEWQTNWEKSLTLIANAEQAHANGNWPRVIQISEEIPDIRFWKNKLEPFLQPAKERKLENEVIKGQWMIVDTSDIPRRIINESPQYGYTWLESNVWVNPRQVKAIKMYNSERQSWCWIFPLRDLWKGNTFSGVRLDGMVCDSVMGSQFGKYDAAGNPIFEHQQDLQLIPCLLAEQDKDSPRYINNMNSNNCNYLLTMGSRYGILRRANILYGFDLDAYITSILTE